MLKNEPDNYLNLWIAGTGLRKLGRLEEALQILERKEEIGAGYIHIIEEEIKLIHELQAHK